MRSLAQVTQTIVGRGKVVVIHPPSAADLDTLHVLVRTKLLSLSLSLSRARAVSLRQCKRCCFYQNKHRPQHWDPHNG